MVLHGNEQNISVNERYWNSSTRAGHLLALLQSSQISFSGGYYWNKVIKGVGELKEHWMALIQSRVVDQERMVIGGFSAGARVALFSVLKGMIKPKAALFVTPWLPEVEHWEPLMNGSGLKGVDFHIICGKDDPDCFQHSKEISRMLDKRGLVNHLMFIEGLGHDYPDDFDVQLEKILEIY